MNKKARKITIVSVLSLLTAVALSFSPVSLAKYIVGQKTTQSAYGLGGERQVSIFFNANIWKQGKDSSGNIVDASYYLYVWHNDGSTDTQKEVLTPAAHITPTVSGTVMDLYVYEFDATKQNRMLFLRWNPEVAPSIDLTTPNGKWNQTVDITYSSTYNYYCIDAWGTGTPATATPTHNRIDKNPSTNELTWGNPA